ncbi:hypothetical protein TUM4261_25480 [Shewanella sp. c952]|uniref:GNAT family N-acetyltransferase n=1 Tax=Shewanella sp. c952 TaxID=2815913 RepID=UPI001BBDFD9B|nr:GNAT family N-acetyltransferase [Shewanella sp. c952]GIU12391.1 hypothetical protein TUM4261_25480 [Shewanella sp. c952]
MSEVIKRYTDRTFEVSDTSLSNNLFSRNDFLFYQSKTQKKKYLSFKLKNANKNKIIFECVFCFRSDNNLFFSPMTGAFSDVFQDASLTPNMLNECFIDIEQYLKDVYGNISLSIALPPLYFANSSSVINCLINLGWIPGKYDVNYHFDICDNFEFRSLISSSKRKCLNKLNRNNYSFDSLELNEFNVKSVYNIISINRTALGYPVTMTEDSVVDLSEHFRHDVKLFCVHKDDVIVASAICLNINEDTLYVFYWAELPDKRAESPILALAEGITLYCKENKIRYLDIGISTENSKPNYGLMNFKKQLGCIESLKLTLTKGCQ